MRKCILKLALVFTLLLAAIPVMVFASDISDADFVGTVQAVNSGAAAANVAANFTLGIDELIEAGILEPDASNIVARDDAGNDIAIQPGYAGNSTIIYYDSIPAGSSRNAYIYTGNVTGGRFAYFPGTAGASVNDTMTAEGNSFEWTFTNLLPELSAGNDKYLYSHYDATNGGIRLSWSDPAAGTLNCAITDSTNTTVSQLVQNTSYAIGAAYVTRAGERFTGLGNIFKINAISFYLCKWGAPAGTANCTVRDASTDALIGTLGTLNVATLAAHPGWAYITFNTPVTVGGASDIRIQMEYSGGDAANYLLMGTNGAGGYANGVATSYAAGVYTDNAAWDATFQNLVYQGIINLSITGITTESDIVLGLAAGTLSLAAGATSNTTAYAGSIPDSTANTTLVEGDACLYVESIEYSQGGAKVDLWDWEYAAVFTGDTTGNVMTPNIRTTGSDPDVSASLISFEPVEEAVADQNTINEWPEMVTTTPPQPSSMYTEETTPGLPGAALIHAIMPDSIPESIFWYNLVFAIILGAGIVAYRIVAEKNQSGLGIKHLVMLALMVFFSLPGPNVFGMYVAIYFVFWSVGPLVLQKHYGW